MKKTLFRSLIRVMPVVLLGVATLSCKDTFDIQPETALDKDQTYQNVFDADAAVIGVYGKFMNLAEQYVVLNELRGDLLNVTVNASSDPDLIQINNHSVNETNKYADPRPFYEVIVNCNDVLANFDKMVQENKMEQAEYAQRYSDIGALRSWVYLQLGIHFGRVPYVTDPLATVADLKDQAKFPVLEFDQLLDALIDFTEGLPVKDQYPQSASLMANTDGYTTQKFFINKQLLLGDLHLWKGNYTQAATHYKAILETGTTDSNLDNYYESYRIAWGYPFSHEVGFTGSQTRNWNYEFIWDLPFNKNFSPKNPFVNLFSDNAGKYLLKPSEAILDKWDAETRLDNTPVDPRAYAAVEYKAGKPVVQKYLENINTSFLREAPGNWFLARAAMVHLRFAEAANRDEKFKVAYALLNEGIKLTYDPDWDPVTRPRLSNNRDVTDIQRTMEAAPYDFDGRQGDFPNYRGAWYRNMGVRGRIGLLPSQIDSAAYYDLSVPSDPVLTNREGLVIEIENKIIEEAALELAFEGNRWPDLLRIAMRRNDPAFLADRVYEKLQKAGNPQAAAVRSKLMNKENWYLPFRWE
ncbi:RagB/SusD family nutrient uptake outer membrane protein [Pontibacter sp. E15-1]|uniref:RagB/SusD family nutrient uptake outer membrane protein n=1 Tax=Pontibacter sp. E15-1 TaxID=2919918 RepID=UPI001F4FE6F2|nr:RagB/SusD family nutrient uptake outer membrane protein [Pontibacter sp. E15-1]MCJ8165931.1 RagB/SusD family nutrient uptake outer membrane protein [Pontibacter sp. E15-1]